MRATRPVARDEGAITQLIAPSMDVPGILDPPAAATTITPAENAIGADPNTERAIGYVALIAGAIAVVILLIGFYKLGKLLAH